MPFATFDLLLLLLVVVFFPYIVVGLVVGRLLIGLAEAVHLMPLAMAVGAAGLSVVAWLNSVPDNTRQWATLVEVFSQGSLFGVSTPVWCALAAVGLFVAASSKSWPRRTAERSA